ncbi:hypothetical protein GOP47_0011950 [Adiantum capillus-veneris]|uniref:Uncharacterized protein n=1 Tax=Adiantum capillus-veneris TaxID=13818 RepID=A0A9D4UU63_ADICA|nr:hypothetical protein GOP47_0011950 [Adiantum capillus-veneris]
MHEDSKEAMDQSSQEKCDGVFHAMVEAVQEEASPGVGQPCPIQCNEERQCIPPSVDDVDLSKNEVIDHGLLFFLANDVVEDEVLEEQAKVVEQSNLLPHEVVEDESSKAMVDEAWQGELGMECMPFERSTTKGMLGTQVGWAMQKQR